MGGIGAAGVPDVSIIGRGHPPLPRQDPTAVGVPAQDSVRELRLARRVLAHPLQELVHAQVGGHRGAGERAQVEPVAHELG